MSTVAANVAKPVFAHYPELSANPDFTRIEAEILDFWKRSAVFEQSVKQRDGAKEYVFYDGPPFANGLPHYGHLLTGYVKDLYARYHTMKGQKVERRFGWDCHGLPAEMGAEKELGISGRQAIQNFGIGNFNEHCRSSVMKYAGEWEGYVDRQARWVDFKNDYKTMDKNFMESVLWAFKQLYDKGLVYESHRVMPYSWAAETPLSNFETKLDNSYRNRTDKAVTVAFKLSDRPAYIPSNGKDVYVLAWTTTPWTLPSNLALAASDELRYCANFSKERDRWEISNQVRGKPVREDESSADEDITVLIDDPKQQLIGLTYEPLFPYFADTPYAFRILDGSSFIEEGSGTGIVHMAPGFGEDDQRVCKENGIDVVVPVDEKGRYTDEIFDIPFHSPLAGESKSAAARLGGGKTDFATSKAQEMRKDPTEAEKKLWEMLSREQLGVKFRRQQPIEHYIVDFYSAEKRLVIEADGGQHADSDADASRTAWLESQGLRVLRFWNNEVLQNPEGVYEKIVEALLPPTKSQGDLAPPQGRSIFSLKGLNVIADTRKTADEPYTDEQLKKYGLANLRIIQWLKENDKLVKQEDYNHNYPHCWRTDTPLIYRALPSWYVEVTKFRDRAVELNQKINWIPEHIRDGQMGHMLATAPDWSISRNRFWGTPIPIWRTESGKIRVFGSIKELEDFFGQKVEDLHRPYIDELTKIDVDGTWTRVSDVFDCWFESGSMPFAQMHYPFENKEWFDTHFPADFITEYVGQTRGWFNTLIMLSTALFDREPFKNCICHGVVIDEETGLKYSKRLKNYKDPMEVFDKYGSDALRWLMVASPVMRGADLGVDPDGKFIHDVVRLYIKPMWNAYYFFTLYANADGVKASHNTSSTNLMDRYILAKCAGTVREIEQGLDAYDSPRACKAVSDFFEVLNNWYIRRNKDRFWNETGHDTDQAAYDTLYTVLTTMCKAAAPLLPMTTEAIYRGLTASSSCGTRSVSAGSRADGDPVQPLRSSQDDGLGSVHLEKFPDLEDFHAFEEERLVVLPSKKYGPGANTLSIPDSDIVMFMELAQGICNVALSIRGEEKIRVRQPLSKLTYYGESGHVISSYLSDIIEEEVNVREFNYAPANKIKDVADYKLKLNSQVIGKRLPAKMKQLIPASKQGQWELKDGKLHICDEILLPEEYELNLEPKVGIKGAAPLSSNDALVVLDLVLTPELEAEGLARDFIRMIQDARKKADLNVSDRISLRYEASGKAGDAIAAHAAAMIAPQVLATTIAQGEVASCAHRFEQALEGDTVQFGFTVAA